MDAFEAITTRRSTRKYKAVPVEPEKLEKILSAGQHAPSGGNNQTTHFIVVTDPVVITELAELVQRSFEKMEITEGMYKSLRASIMQSKKGNYRFCYNAPVLVILANQKDYGNNIADAAVAAENMMIEANELDLGSCYINQLKWLNEDPDIVDYMIKIGMKDSERIYASVILGYPDTEDGMPDRKALERTGNIITYV